MGALRRAGAVAATGTALALALAGSAAAVTISPNTTSDTYDATDHDCSLREAIGAANMNIASGNVTGECPAGGGGDDVVDMGSGHYSLSIPPQVADDNNLNGDLDVIDRLTLRGTGPANTSIDAHAIDRAIDLRFSTSLLTIEGVTVTGGKAPDGTAVTDPPIPGTGMAAGGAPGNPGADGGGIHAEGALVVRNSALSGNFAGAGSGGASAQGGPGATGGGAGGSGAGGHGGAGGAGGAIQSTAAVTIERSTISDNHSGAGGSGGNGTGGAGGDGDGTHAGGTGGLGGGAAGGAGGAGGAIEAFGPLTVTDSTIAGNATGGGGEGGVAIGGAGGPGVVNVQSGGHGGAANGGAAGAGGAGGAIDAGGTASLTRSTVSANSSGGGGLGGGALGGHGGAAGSMGGTGGVGGDGHGGGGGEGGTASGIDTAGPATLSDDTFDANAGGAGAHGGGAFGGHGGDGLNGSFGGAGGAGTGAFGGAGGGGALVTGAPASLGHLTVSANSSGSGATGGAGQGGPGGSGAVGGAHGAGLNGPDSGASRASAIVRESGTTTEANTIVASNANPSCFGVVSDGGHDIVFGDTSCPGSNVDPLLGALADNGGPTLTRAIAATSPARDAVPASGAGCSAADQRGTVRPQGPACDVGAFEIAVPQPPGPGPPGSDTVAPVFVSASVSPAVFAVGAQAASARATKHKKGTTFSYVLSEAAATVFTLERRTTGRRVGKRCRKRTRKNAGKRHCTRYVRAGRFAQVAAVGKNSKRFSGRIGKRALKPARYRARLVATDAARNSSKPRLLAFRVVRR
jgi:CSLREA domain-containing protein